MRNGDLGGEGTFRTLVYKLSISLSIVTGIPKERGEEGSNPAGQ